MKTFQEYREEYEQTSIEIEKMYARQRDIQKRMRETCPHERVIKIESDSFLVESGLEDEGERYKCRDCFRYFTEQQLVSLYLEGS